ncbi:decarboxylating NADP(+)-dependent phosphogluconate dehydrogenase [Anaerospora sp.]|jgi:6-phosphogluconate dehydrogenase|uniref:decarboxylating NADP(+)-dependent phosphogluconate dehydrogenase n=1 Tax=Anaerospora sp. TaxID=1960278 RepID=UPI0028984862|nr:decarboxylating NADP(+)-dependent phosphogluconate dehydrogenase [Anaerospora sp.]MDF2929073.1 6-phosphogluconate dehydrogenase, decarboxylating [Anaerospora sp.]
MQLCDIGLIGLAVMGENLVLNMAGKGFSVAVYNRTVSKVDEFVAAKGQGMPVKGAHSPQELVSMLAAPRKIVLMVKAGKPVDDMIAELLPFLEQGDILIDGGNSFFEDTRRRNQELTAKGIRFIGMGVSGGEEGALKGPSLMPGSDRSAYEETAPIFTRIAAQVADGPCCAYVGPDGAGHYVKMVHNGIEYGDMQLISEAYYIMKTALQLTADELHEVFSEWNKGELDSYLIEITRDIFTQVDEVTGQPLVELILDKAGQKGTGKWTSQSALDLGVATPTITEAVFARCMSAYKTERVAASAILAGPDATFTGDKQAFIEAIRDALYASKICSYAQGFALLKAASEEYGWNLNYGDMALLWRGGCIIRARFLDRIKEAFTANKDLANLLIDPYFSSTLAGVQNNWRLVVKTCKELGIPTPAFSASLDYYDSYRRAVLPANLIQAQRDYFGAHTYERVDKPGTFHTEWGK